MKGNPYVKPPTGKRVLVEGKRYPVFQHLGYSSRTNGYGTLLRTNEGVNLAIKLVGEKEYKWIKAYEQ